LGSSLFFLYGLPRVGTDAALTYRWPRHLLVFSSAILLVGAVFGLITQTGLLAGSFAEGLKLSNLEAVVTQMNFGWSNIVRGVLAAVMLLCLVVVKPSTSTWLAAAMAGAISCASFAWMGHGAATDDGARYVHLLADIAHSLAAALWIGALLNFAFLLLPHARVRETDQVLCNSLLRFSGVGSAAVAILVVSGLINSWFLVGLQHVSDFWKTLYGQVLLAKLVVFIGMLFLAASNRYFLTPGLQRILKDDFPQENAITRLRRSLIVETLAAFVVLALVALLGTLAPANVQ